MDLRRVGEFGFGVAALSCGGVFLALAAGRLTAPVTAMRTDAAPAAVATAVAIVAAPARSVPVRSIPVRVAVRGRPHVASQPAVRHAAARSVVKMSAPTAANEGAIKRMHLPPVAAREGHRPLAVVPRAVVRPTRPIVLPIRGRDPGPASGPRPVATIPSFVDARAIVLAYPAGHRRNNGPPVPPAPVSPHPLAEPQPIVQTEVRPPAPAIAAKLAGSSRRQAHAERTPEPPIGYDARPALLRSDGPGDVLPTIAPVQVQLSTTHLAR